ncbi:MAG: histidine triad nucleotide-binding protein [Deltaproteobacteria bacterium]|nr:histidine triad nucleotide-binding protein [Deltaproteobacteria bacterium]
MESCVFCDIAARKIPARILLEDEALLAFEDVRPQAPLHALVIPKRHVAHANELRSDDADLLGKLVLAAQQVARLRGAAESGWRLVMNTLDDAGQTVFHLHLHVLGGRELGWPPG